jgi:hypothetical protein
MPRKFLVLLHPSVLTLGAIVFGSSGIVAQSAEAASLTPLTTINFDDLSEGDRVLEQYADIDGSGNGVIFSATKKNGNGTRELWIYDSNCQEFTPGDCSGGDHDLATGSNNFNSSETPVPDLETEGNILIIQEQTSVGAAPDDHARGGIITLDFTNNLNDEGIVVLNTLRFIDIDHNPNRGGVIFTAYDANGGSTTYTGTQLLSMTNGGEILFAGIGSNPEELVPSPDTPLSDNSVVDFNLSVFQGIQKLDIKFTGSGGLAEVNFCTDVAPGGTEWWCEDSNGHMY